jgi:hypothetical protein
MKETAMSEELWFVDPTAGGNKTEIRLAQRPIDLIGKTVGLIDNTKEQADVILETIADELRGRYGVKEVIIERKEAFSRPAKPELIDALARKVQVAAAAVGG